MAYSKTVWVNDNAPALNATNLNKIENGIYDNAENVDDLLEGLINLDTTASPGTTDGDLYDAIDALGWASDVIE
jgi:hypothetical protein